MRMFAGTCHFVTVGAQPVPEVTLGLQSADPAVSKAGGKKARESREEAVSRHYTYHSRKVSSHYVLGVLVHF